MCSKKRLRQTIAPRSREHGESAALLGTEAGRHHHRAPGKRSPPKRSANAAASSSFAKQNTKTSTSLRRIEYVSGAADRLSAKPRTASLFVRPSTAGSATWCGRAPGIRSTPKRSQNASASFPVVKGKHHKVACACSTPFYRDQPARDDLEQLGSLLDRLTRAGCLDGAVAPCRSGNPVDIPPRRSGQFGWLRRHVGVFGRKV
jgi:hypothetical protein